MVDETNTGKTEATQNINAGVQPSKFGAIERAEQAVQRIGEAEKRLDDKIATLTELETNRLLGSTAGGHIEMKTPEQIKQERVQREADEIVKAFK